MQLRDLVKPIEECSDEELMERLRKIRNNRMVERPAGKARAKRAAKKETQTKVKKVTQKFNIATLTDEQRQQMIALLKGDKA